MLVLSRKKNQCILFPSLGITLEILRVSGNAVSVGVKAPQSIRVLRGELNAACDAAKQPMQQAPVESQVSDPGSFKLSHELRNQLNQVFLAIALVQKQLNLGLHDEAEMTLQSAFELLTKLDQGIDVDSDESTAFAAENSAQQAEKVDSRPTVLGRTLLVEDDPNERALLAGYLRMAGYQVLTAKDGVEALELLAREQVDLVVLDMRMPRMNGAETIAAIRKDPFLKDLKVIVVSGDCPNTTLPTVEKFDIDRWLSKPLDPAKLVTQLEASLN
ncbi:MAG TPA: response regulator [Pirellulaceae bacterium]|nr:response regulator [Pirellulaceae bacterium]HMO91144.1 response regulator [Pirellulaceae bacterium]HMP69085.1 response regulator [Pirellulaceae bacterium]